MTFSTESIGLDIAMGGGWIPGLHEVWGDPGSAKTTVLKHAANSAVKAGLGVLWLDLSLDVNLIDAMPDVYVARPRNAEEAFDLAIGGAGIFDLIVFDPAHMLVRQAELDDDPEYVPHPQREYARELTDLKHAALDALTVVLFASRPRDKERQPVRGTGISEKVTYRVHLHPDVVHQTGTREIVATVRHVPSKTVTHDAARFIVRPRLGIDRERELIDTGLRLGVVQQSGTWLSYGGSRHHGVGQFARYLTANHSMAVNLDNDIRVVAGIA